MMGSKRAFPMVINGDEYQTGMLLRDYFAGQALAGLCSHNDFTDGSYDTIDGFALFAKWSYDFADAMLAEREKEEIK